ncbi:MAG TPA: anti-sigma factor [Nitrososphaeraceae archaeon]
MTHSVAFVLTLATSITLIVSSFTIVQQTLAQQVSMDITKPSGDKPFGGEKIGTVGIIPNGHVLNIVANMSAPPDNGKVWEGWLVDDGGSGYKLSLGELAKNGTLHLTEEMVNPYTYSQFIVTQGPFEDPDPNAAAASGGTQLQTPFGR